METYSVLAIFIFGYIAISFEHVLKINKAAVALITGTLCWTFYILGQDDKHSVLHQLESHFGEIASILFFLLGAMVIVELIDAHDGFEVITSRIKTKGKRQLLWISALLTFFLSAVLDNLTTTIVMISLLRNIVSDRADRLTFAGVTIIAANAGGAWSPIGDVTTTMLWIGGQITGLSIIRTLFLPSLFSLLVPLIAISYSCKGDITRVHSTDSLVKASPTFERNVVFLLGLGILVFVPIFKTLTHLPPVIAMLFGLGVLWVLTELIHQGKDEAEKGLLSVNHAIRKIDTPSILFFLGILLSIAALQANGVLGEVAFWLDDTVGNQAIIGILIGLLSAVVDNVPLMAAAQAMYPLTIYPTDHFFWNHLAYCTGTGGSALIIGSAAGVAAMGMEKIDFAWYLKNITVLALIGYFSGAAAFLLL